MTSDITLFVNPVAGGGRGVRAAGPVADALLDAGYEVQTVQGADAAEALAGVREAVAAGTGAVIVVGGDGMTGLALQAVAGTRTPIGVVSVGTGNDFARAIGLPVRNPRAAAEAVVGALEAGRTRDIDLGRVGETYFGTIMASGFDSRVNDRGNRMSWPPGRFRYDVAMLAELASFRAIPYRIRLDDGPEIETEATLVAVGNGPSYGGGLRMCHGAQLDDGLFHITVVGRASRVELLRFFPKVYKGAHLSHPAVTVHQAAKISLTAADVTGYADGEPLGPLPLTAECVPAAARVLVP